MPNITIGFALALIALGFAGYIPTGAKTALIPARCGILLLVCGILAKKDNLRKHAMHGAAMLALLGFLGSAGGLLKLPAALSGAAGIIPAAVFAKSVMAILMLVFLVLCVRSFIAARKNR
jgi:hypothetical protein